MTKNTFNNILANFGSKIWGFTSIYIFIPLYLKLLGIESYAVISFYAVIFGVISFADAGVSASINREFAKVSPGSYKRSILHIFEKIYLAICILLCLIIMIAAPLIAKNWLHADNIGPEELTYYVRLIGIGVSLQLFTSIYFGGLMGLQKQVSSNLIQTGWSIAKSAGVLGAMVLIRPSLEVFFIWQIICNVLYLVILRYYLLNFFKGEKITLKMAELPSDLWKYMGGMLIIAIISAINIQTDKLITSNLFSLKDFGYYSLASTISQIPVMVATPIVLAIFPHMTKTISGGNNTDLIKTYKVFSFCINILVIPICLVIVLYCKDLLLLWTSRQHFDEKSITLIEWSTKLLVIGGTFLAFQLMPYYFLLSHGRTKYTIKQGLIQICFMVPALYYFIGKFGFPGAGIPWLIINTCAFAYIMIVVLARYFKDNAVSILTTTFLVPVFVNVCIAALIYSVTNALKLPSGIYTLLYGAVLGMASIIINVLIFTKANGVGISEIIKRIKK